jgi:hypothetical protein
MESSSQKAAVASGKRKLIDFDQVMIRFQKYKQE